MDILNLKDDCAILGLSLYCVNYKLTVTYKQKKL